MRIFPAIVALVVVAPLSAQSVQKKPDGNRLAYLDEVNPYYPHRDFAKLTTPQWVGDKGVEAVVILAIDDMRDSKPYERFLRPILNRLKKIDGRAPVSIMTNRADPKDPQLQAWLKEGLSLECHTHDHPCPFFMGGFEKARDTYDKCVDLMHEIPNSKPVAFRMPCCDSMNTPSPRFYAEIFNKTTVHAKSLSIDSSVFNVFTSADKSLPRELVLQDGKERFRKYLPSDRDFVNYIEDYPYPYVIGGQCWEFPCVTPSDWQAQHLHKSNNPITVRDMKASLDCTVIKQGVYCLVFHPHGWIKNEQIIDIIDHAVEKYGKKVKFLTFKEALERLETNLIAGQRWRSDEAHYHMLDVNGDGYMDVVRSGKKEGVTRLWMPGAGAWKALSFPTNLHGEFGSDMHFGILGNGGAASLVVRAASPPMGIDRIYQQTWHFTGSEWLKNEKASPTILLDGGTEHAIRFLLRDIDGDGACEMLTASGAIQTYHREDGWVSKPVQMPTRSGAQPMKFVDGLRFLDLDGDNKLDIVYSNDKEFGVYLFSDMEKGWSKQLMAGKAGDKNALPPIARNGTNNGCWVHSGSLWWGNEDTAILKNHVNRRSFRQLLEAK